MILDTIVRPVGKQVEQRKQAKSLEQMMKATCGCREREGIKGDAIKRAGIKRENGTNEIHPFKMALSEPGVFFVYEVKKASPSKGLIAPDFPYVKITRQYQEVDADAASVLTELELFLEADRYLKEAHREMELPLLRKDFIVDEHQIYEAKVLEASAVLLVCSLMGMEKLKRYMGIYGSLGLSFLAEIHIDREVVVAAEAGADIIGINNRNLETSKTNFANALGLRKSVDQGAMFVAGSGIRTPEDTEPLAENRVDAALVRETLMRASDKERTLRELKFRIG